MAYVTVDVDIDLDEFNDNELVEEVKARGYTVVEEQVEKFDMEDWKLLLEIVDTVPETVYTRRVKEKLMNQRWGPK
jgi:hypothetical protein